MERLVMDAIFACGLAAITWAIFGDTTRGAIFFVGVVAVLESTKWKIRQTWPKFGEKKS
jgi:hypothetical protein